MPTSSDDSALPRGLPRYTGPAFLVSVADNAIDVLILNGLSPTTATCVAQDIVARVARVWGGEHIRIPKGTLSRTPFLWFERRARDIEIYNAFDGQNIPALVEKYGLQERMLRNILRRVQLLVREDPTLLQAAPGSGRRER